MPNIFTLCNFGCRCFLFIAISVSVAAADTCQEPIARVVSTQGDVKLNNSVAVLDASICQSDTIFVGSLSRAAIVLLSSDTVLRIDQNTTLTLIDDSKQNGTLLELIEGALNLLSPAVRALDVRTPFVNASVEGTEFLVRVESDRTLISVFEGLVVATSSVGSLNLSEGQSSVTLAGEAPVRRTIVRPRDGVQWALYYPPIGVDEKTSALTREASDILAFGRVDEAMALLIRSRNENPDDAVAIALLAIIATTKNLNNEAIQLAEQAVATDSTSSAAYTALSYVQQSLINLDGALESARQAVINDQYSAYAWSRLAELQLSNGELNASLQSARRAVEIDPALSHTQTVLGFAHLTRIETDKARDVFNRAIHLNSEDPLPRLGLGLAKIRNGDLSGGRQDIEIAVALDSNNSLIRSYLGKAYFEEKRDRLDARQYGIAKALDPKDPTPWFYDAIRKQTINRPVDALQDLLKSIELNDNRAVFRSQLLMDSDLAARSANLARIYSDLGFEQLALVEGWKSVDRDFGNSSGHRLLAESYASLPKHKIAQVSELLQAQLRQPLLYNPAPTKLNGTDLPKQDSGTIFPAGGTFNSSLATSFNEYSSLFTQDHLKLQVSANTASHRTFEEEIILSSVHGNFSGSVNQYRYVTDGIRVNQDSEQEQNIGTVFFQHAVTPNLNWQFEGRLIDWENVVLLPGLDPSFFQSDIKDNVEVRLARLGGRFKISPNSDFIANITHVEGNFDENLGATDILDIEDDGIQVEFQNLSRIKNTQFITGLGYFQRDRSIRNTIGADQILGLETTEEHSNLYAYALSEYSRNFTSIVGIGFENLRSAVSDSNQITPKLGIEWKPASDTTVRAAGFRTIKRGLLSQSTLEPTSIAGFNQFFDDGEGTDASRYGIAVDQAFNANIYGGAELSLRRLKTPQLELNDGNSNVFNKQKENLHRAYLYWTPTRRLSFSAEYRLEKLQQDSRIQNNLGALELKSNSFVIGINYFHPSGYLVHLSPTFANQSGLVDSSGVPERVDDQFWTTDIEISYKLPNRRGSVGLGIKNVFDERFDFRDTDSNRIGFLPERFFFGKLILFF